jgi:hypothetical protein
MGTFNTQDPNMFTTLSALALTYAAGTGALTNLAVIGRGLVRAAEQLFDGDYQSAAIEALAGLAAPALITYHAASGLMTDVADVAFGIASDVLPDPDLACRLAS